MNALWLSRLCAYKQTPEAHASMCRLIELKVAREGVLLTRYGREPFAVPLRADTTEELLLYEARAARHFWGQCGQLLPAWAGYEGRVPGARDAVNRLLDVGFHHLAQVVRAALNERGVPAELGLLHVPRTRSSEPLVYDLMEPFRADIIDAEVLRYFRLKKRPIERVEPEIPRFLARVNARLARHYYLREFGQCHTYRYYLALQILKFVKAVNHRSVFEPIALPSRHESRCLLTH